LGTEIERKYLVKGNFRNGAVKEIHVRQGYISSLPDKTVRVRINSGKGYITVKARKEGLTFGRFEWEREIPLADAEELMTVCDHGTVEKTRYIVPFMGQNFEVDVFEGENSGLIVAELELETEEQPVIKPSWLGDEVTFDGRYQNSYLAKVPYKKWI
jgi:adenylate cyclase